MNDTFWYVYNRSFEREEGPFNEDEMFAKIEDGELTSDSLVYHNQMANWEPAGRRSEFARAFDDGRTAAAPPPPAPSGTTVAHEIDYEIFGEDLQFVEITLDPLEACVAEAGSFMYMAPGIEMKTIFGDGSGQDDTGFLGKLLNAGKRVLTVNRSS